MRQGGGKQKGNAFERDICKKLSLWVSAGAQTDVFWRTAMSGGRSTVARQKKVHVRQAGDICAVAPEGHALTDKFYIECKSYRTLSIDRFIVLETGTLMRFWKETRTHARKHGKQPLLIARQNGYPVLIISNVFLDAEALYKSRGTILYKMDDVLAKEYK